jgi:hypothetical protein
MQNLAIDSVALGDRVMVLTDGRSRFYHGTEIMTGVVTATRYADTEAAIGSKIDFPVREIFG